MKTIDFRGIMNVHFYNGMTGVYVTVHYWSNRKPKTIHAENKAEAFKKMTKTERNFCLNSKNRKAYTHTNYYSVSYWYNR